MTPLDADDELYVPIYAINTYLFCPHRAYREYVLGEWADNRFTVDAEIKHRRVHQAGRRTDQDTIQTTRVWIKSERLGLIGQVDIVEETDGDIHPVEYKRGRAPRDNDRAQLCAQAMCLEEMLGQTIEFGEIFYFATRERVRIVFTRELRDLTLKTIGRVREVFEGHRPPAVHSPKCEGCSIRPLCLPVETAILAAMEEG